MGVNEFSEYLEQLCREHRLLRHGDEERHYVNLNEDARNTSIAEELRYPAVFFETTGYRVAGSSMDDMTKTHTCHIEVFAHVADTGDYAEVERALSDTERILDDIFARINIDRYRRRRKLLQGVALDGVEAAPMQNEKNALYGWAAELKFRVPFCMAEKDAFINLEDNGKDI